jgi:putative transposase
MFLLRPDGPTSDAVIYCLGLAAQRAEIDVVAFLAMSNHWHGVVVDRTGRLPEFLECFHKLLAKHQNALRGRWENFWASEQTSVVELVDPADVLDKLIYTLTNPVADHLVSRARHWPGASSVRESPYGEWVEASRPRRFFRADGPCPPAIRFRLRRPPGFEHLSSDEFATLLREKIAEREAAAAFERAETGRQVLGRAAILRQSWRDQPDTVEPRRQLDPRVACMNVWRRVEALRRNKLFVVAYQAMRALWRLGETAVFPYGTYWLRRFAGAPCDPKRLIDPGPQPLTAS